MTKPGKIIVKVIKRGHVHVNICHSHIVYVQSDNQKWQWHFFCGKVMNDWGKVTPTFMNKRKNVMMLAFKKMTSSPKKSDIVIDKGHSHNISWHSHFVFWHDEIKMWQSHNFGDMYKYESGKVNKSNMIKVKNVMRLPPNWTTSPKI
jgi:hypothetical protein